MPVLAVIYGKRAKKAWNFPPQIALLRFIDVPKIRTITMFGEKIIRANFFVMVVD
jgi:hypothetical protein